MFPGKSDQQIGELVAEYFNQISQEYEPLGDEEIPARSRPVERLECFKVAAVLRSFKKPRSQVRGDIAPKLVTQNSDILAIPLTAIYNNVLQGKEWPILWKLETVTVIPKTTSPNELKELRNLSCTPLFSKVLESFVLARLREETRFQESQYGGPVSYTHLTLPTIYSV